MNYRFISNSEQDTVDFAAEIGKQLKGGEFIALSGELGAGKTYFSKGLARSLDIAEEEVVSPTFTLVNEYRGRLNIYHADFYRIDTLSELDSTGLWEYLDGDDSVVIIEWAEKFKDSLPEEKLDIMIVNKGENVRELILSSYDSRHSAIIKNIAEGTVKK